MSKDTPSSLVKTPGADLSGFDWMAQQNGGQFDPVLFGDYRESQDAVTSGDFGSFFNEAYPFAEFGSPFNTGLSPMPKRNILQEMDDKLDDDEEVVPGEDPQKMLNCTSIWDRLQKTDKFQNGELDVDGLCSELRAKARCSETGVVVNEKDVDELFAKYPAKQVA